MSHTDIKNNDWVSGLSPRIAPYLRLARFDRLIGAWLLLLPGWWAILLASSRMKHFDLTTLKIMALFALGAVVMRGAGCIVNDLWDMKYDRMVERTKTRPLASGEIKPWQALVFLLFLLLAGLAILLQFSLVTILLGFLSLPLIIVYPLMKRWTWWPQAMLGLTFNFGALMGWGAVADVVALPALFLYAAGFFWTLGYDTIYAHQDKEDDALIGVKSTALLFGIESRKWVGRFYAASVALLVIAGISAGAGRLYFAMLLPAAYHLYWQAGGWDIDDPADSLERFRSNRNFGLLVALAALL